jgi:HSP20 family molecular chaperone IbpA
MKGLLFILLFFGALHADTNWTSKINALENGLGIHFKSISEKKDRFLENVSKKYETQMHVRTNIVESNSSFIYELELPGVKKSDISANIEGNTLKILYSRDLYSPEYKGYYLKSESKYGEFVKKLVLPKNGDARRAKSSLKDGILKIIIPKTFTEKKMDSLVIE